jgi:hypothetical protein
MEAGGRVLYEIPRDLVARAQRRFKITLTAGLGVAIVVLVLPLASSPEAISQLGNVYLILIPAWLIPLFMALLSYRLLRFNNGLTITEGGYYPAFRLRRAPRSKRSFVPLDDMEKVSVDERGEEFTAVVSLWNGRGVVLTSADLVRYFREPIRAEFPRIVEAFGKLRSLVAARTGFSKGRR